MSDVSFIADLFAIYLGSVILVYVLVHFPCLSRSSKALRYCLLIERLSEQAEEVKVFLDLFLEQKRGDFDDAYCSLKKSPLLRTRKPARSPEEEDIKKLRDYCVKGIATNSRKSNPAKISGIDYVRLRHLILTRLTIFNAWRGGEPVRTSIRQLPDALHSVWLNGQRTSSLEEGRI